MWGAMRLDGSTPDERRDYAAFIEQVTTTGQTPGTSIGELPVGYAPLSEELRAKAAEAVKKIRAYTDPTEAPPVDAPDGDTPTPQAMGPACAHRRADRRDRTTFPSTRTTWAPRSSRAVPM